MERHNLQAYLRDPSQVHYSLFFLIYTNINDLIVFDNETTVLKKNNTSLWHAWETAKDCNHIRSCAGLKAYIPASVVYSWLLLSLSSCMELRCPCAWKKSHRNQCLAGYTTCALPVSFAYCTVSKSNVLVVKGVIRYVGVFFNGF